MLTRTRMTSRRLGADERSRIARDLREDLGARLLNQLSRTENPASAAETRALLTELRSLLDVLDPRRFMLGECVDEWHAALADLCADQQIKLQWDAPARWTPLPLSPLQRCNPLLVLREFMRNAALHSQPSFIEFRLRKRGNTMTIRGVHDGLIEPPQAWQAARGLRMAGLRAQDLQGRLAWSTPSPGTLQLDLRFPLP